MGPGVLVWTITMALAMPLSASRELVVGQDDCGPSGDKLNASALSYDYGGTGSYGGSAPSHYGDRSDDDDSMQMLLGVGFASLVVLVGLGLLWRACWDCCKRSERYARHRAFVQRIEQGRACNVCYHSNDTAQPECVLCGTSLSDLEIRVEPVTQDGASAHSGSNYHSFATPRAVQPGGPSHGASKLSDRQRVAFERHEWKRCIGARLVRWVRLTAADIRGNRKLRGTIIQERVLLKNERRKAGAATSSSSSSSEEETSSHGLFRCAGDNNVQIVIATLAGSRGFVRDDRVPAAAKWRSVDEIAYSARGYTKDVQLFAPELGLFAPANSSAHGGHWIRRDAALRSQETLEMYRFFGKVLGKTLLEGLLLSVRLSVPLLKHLLGAPFTLADVRLLDETVYASLQWILAADDVGSLGLDFTVDGVELVPGGASVALGEGNKLLYVDKVAQFYLFESVRDELACVLEGLRSVVPEQMLHVFDYKELDVLVSGLAAIDVADWRAHTDLRLLGECMGQELAMVEWFWEIVEAFDQDERGRLLQYVTGSSSVPAEGFQGLTGMDGALQLFTIQLTKTVSMVYTVLPFASTCLNRCVFVLRGGR
ncbi:hypothetical protein PybrP1_011668 [[Pythium] brassicae (nom. inval.)]|nr:hypothetical protein PybrP1_011668 [[Pythium] brassicae (nom. inval.)]